MISLCVVLYDKESRQCERHRQKVFGPAHALRELGNLPLAVVTAGSNTPNGWPELQADLATLSTNSSHLFIPEANHGSLVLNPADAQQVSTVILQVLALAQR